MKDSKPKSKAKSKSPKSTGASIDLDNPEFQNAWKILNFTRQSLFLTGKAGTGKSTFLRHIVDTIKKKTVVLAPTGIAAVNAGGQTLHSFFKIPLKPILPDDPDFHPRRLRERMKYSSSQVKLLREIELIVIDEISMVRADIIDFIDRILRVYCHNMREPFGGKQLLLVGDVFQLEPVVTGDARDILGRCYQAPYFFNARVFSELQIVSIELRKVYRQDDSEFVGLLDRVRAGQPTSEDIMRLNSRLMPPDKIDIDSEDMTMTIATRRDMVDHINERHLAELTTPVMVYKGKIEDDFPMSSLPTDLELSLKVGAQIVFIKNDPERRWVNGTVGIVEDLKDDRIGVRLDSGDLVDVEREIWGNVRYQYNEETHKVDEIELGRFIQFPIKLAWALTIHKSQGLTFNKVRIDIGRGAFSGGQTYVALSRCRSLEGISLCSTLNRRDIFVNRYVMDFAAGFNDTRTFDRAMESARADSLYYEASQAFEKGDTSRAVELFHEAITARNEFDKPEVRRLVARKLNVINRLREENERLRARVEQDRQRFADIASNYLLLGNDCAEAGEYQGALANYRRALEYDPGNHTVLLLMAQLETENGESEKALELLTRALKLVPDDVPTLLTIGDLYNGRGDYAAAMDHYLRAHAAKPKSRKVLRRIIDLFESMGDLDSADQYRDLL